MHYIYAVVLAGVAEAVEEFYVCEGSGGAEDWCYGPGGGVFEEDTGADEGGCCDGHEEVAAEICAGGGDTVAVDCATADHADVGGPKGRRDPVCNWASALGGFAPVHGVGVRGVEAERGVGGEVEGCV